MISMFKAILLVHVFDSFRNMYLQIYELDPAKFISASGLAWQSAFGRTKEKLDLLTGIDMLLMVTKGIRREMCHSVNGYSKTYNKYMENYDKNKESSYLQFWDVNNLYGWAASQKLQVNIFEWDRRYLSMQWRVYKKL